MHAKFRGNGVAPCLRTLQNIFVINDEPPVFKEHRIINKCIKKVSEDLERFSFNTGISSLMICLNELIQLNCNKKDIIHQFIILLSPYAPFISEEIWESLDNKTSINSATWPVINNDYLKDTSFSYPVSFNGKMRFILDLSNDISEEEAKKSVLKNSKTAKYVGKNHIKRFIFIKNKIINVVF